MRRTIALAVAALMFLINAFPIAAQESASDDPTITAAGVGEIGELPAGAGTLRLLRITLQPGGALPWNPGRQEATGGLVIEGAVAIHFEFDAIHQPLSGDSISVSPGSVINAVATDGFFAGKDTTFTILNVSSAPAVVVLGMIEPNAWAPVQPVSRYVNFNLVQSELLGVGEIPELLSGPSSLVVARASYEPGQGDDVASPSGGPTIAYVEEGEFTYGLDTGSVELTTAASGATPVATQPVAPGSTVTIRQGDTVFEQDASTLVRNDSSVPAVVYVIVLVPTA